MSEEDAVGTSFPVLAWLKRLPLTAWRAPVTATVCVVMVVVFVCLRASQDPDAMLARFGYRTAFQVWTGDAWGLVTSNFVHQWYWHIALNLGAMWGLGIAVEEVIGWLRMVVLVLASALVSFAVQLAIFDDVGAGASGIVYALFGYGWVAREKFESLRATFTRRTLSLAMLWLIAGFVFFLRTIANGAHLGGLVFGACAALPSLWERRRWLVRLVPMILVVASCAIGFVCPWSPQWWAAFGYTAHESGAYPWAIKAYGKSLAMRPDQPWVRENLSTLLGDAGVSPNSGP